MTASRKRQPLRQFGGKTTSGGAPELADILVRAMKEPERVPEDVLTHGFHAYPARMHWAIARVVLQAWGQPGTRVADVFCGSATVPIEASVAGLSSTGIELNPVALRLAEVKTRHTTAEDRATFAQHRDVVVEATLDRVRRRAPARAPISAREVQWYEVHVLKELASLWAEIGAVTDERIRTALEMVFSAILVKFSRQQADTAETTSTTRVPKGFVTRFFARKCDELLRRWEELAQARPPSPAPVTLIEGDARKAPSLLGPATCDLLLSSPPYGGTYDYLHHHQRRYAWLGVDTKAFAQGELGARRRLSQGKRAGATWDEECSAMLGAMRKILTPTGQCILLVGDGEVGGRRVDALQQLQRLAAASGLEPRAWASQARQDWRGGAPRREHLVALTAMR